jgi:glycosyltransferase involved in cell wall biosynthesis
MRQASQHGQLALMKIGIDATCWWNQRGFGRMARELLKAMFALPSEHSFVLFIDQEPAVEMLRSNIEVLQVFPDRPLTAAATAADRRSLFDLLKMYRAVKQSDVDLMFFPAVYSWFPVPGKLPTVVTLHDAIAEHFPELIFPHWRGRMLWNLKMKLALRTCDRVMTVSKAARSEIAQYIGVKPGIIDVISEAPSELFVKLDTLDCGLRERLGLPQSGRLVVYVGGLAPHKNLQGFMQGFAQAKAQGGLEDLHLVLVGDYEGAGFHSNYAELRRASESAGLQESVHFTGFVSDEDLVLLYNAAFAVGMPSFSEGFGLPAVEAMACGTPVLSSELGSLPEVVGETGVYFDPFDVNSIAHAIRRMGTEEGLRDELGRRALKRAAEFTWERAARLAMGFLEQTGRG